MWDSPLVLELSLVQLFTYKETLRTRIWTGWHPQTITAPYRHLAIPTLLWAPCNDVCANSTQSFDKFRAEYSLSSVQTEGKTFLANISSNRQLLCKMRKGFIGVYPWLDFSEELLDVCTPPSGGGSWTGSVSKTFILESRRLTAVNKYHKTF